MLKNVGFNLSLIGKRLLGLECVRFIHTGSLLQDKERCNVFKARNEQIFPPQLPGEPRRPAYVCHVNESVKFSYKKMWYVACFIRGMAIDEALKQLQFLQSKGAKIATETLLQAQQKAVKEHCVEFKSNLWVSESFVGKSFNIYSHRRHARGQMAKIKHGFIHHFVSLEEGPPPKHYYYYNKPLTGEEMLENYVKKLRNRRVITSI